MSKLTPEEKLAEANRWSGQLPRAEFEHVLTLIHKYSQPLIEVRDRLRAEVGALQAFKDYVHERLDQANIPTHPDGEHSKAGCRIGDRLDIALPAQAEVDHAKSVSQQLATDNLVFMRQRDETANRNARLQEAVELARDTFQRYSDLHAAKPDMEKANRNCELAHQMRVAVTGDTSKGPSA